MDKIIKEYKNDDITVVWQPHLCIHATICFAKLPLVFRPNKRPWIDLSNADTESIIETVDLCPTDALTWRWNKKSEDDNAISNENNPYSELKAKLLKNGPMVLPKAVRLLDSNGIEIKPGQDKCICLCGKSKNKPFCDGSHSDV